MFHITDFSHTLQMLTNNSIPNSSEDVIPSNHAIGDELMIGHGQANTKRLACLVGTIVCPWLPACISGPLTIWTSDQARLPAEFKILEIYKLHKIAYEKLHSYIKIIKIFEVLNKYTMDLEP